ncbi:MAG TPA: amino acid adenylation domain-containing protein, partial [Pedococcus sp.]|nr:amino acid adenylation domain-containing protein [Pedococcus sp.]
MRAGFAVSLGALGPTASLLRGDRAPLPRTLVDIFRETVLEFGDHPAIDNGASVLTYAELAEAMDELATELNAAGVGVGDRVGIRIRSGTTELYTAILGVLAAGAAYVPADADDPDERARLVFGEAGVAAIIRDDLAVSASTPDGPIGLGSPAPLTEPTPADDAWIIFTSGSTGLPKGVAVSHRSASAFVDAEARLFLQERPLGVGDRVMAGLSVAFDASCEEMWLAWRHGACLVPAPRSLVRSGMELGPWLVANEITVVSTVPTLVALWPTAALLAVRLVILGGEACPPEIGARLASPEREVWNTYGPTETTVVACAAPLSGEDPVRIGLPLDGWDLAVVGPDGDHVGPGETGELIIGGVGLARYLDPAKDAEKYAPMPTLGWTRAYRSGDLVRFDPAGLVFRGRADDQVKVGGRRIELGELDSALLALPGVSSAAAAVRRTGSGNVLIVGYVVVTDGFDLDTSMEGLRARLPAPMVPRLAAVEVIPTRTSGKVDRDALAWPLPTLGSPASSTSPALDGTAGWLQELWLEIVGAVVVDPTEDFFDVGGGSLAAAQLVSRLRERFPEVTVADLYERPRLGEMAGGLDEMATPAATVDRNVRPVPRSTQLGQVLFSVPLRALAGLRWITWMAAANNAAYTWLGVHYLPRLSWWVVVAGWVLLLTPPGRILLAAGGARLLLRGITPGRYPRGGTVQLRVWAAERLADEVGAANLSGAPWMRLYARALGCRLGQHVDLHAIPPVTGMLTLGDECSIEPEVDLNGHWLDGDVLHLGSVSVGRRARVGARSMLCPGAAIGEGAELAPGSAVFGTVPSGEFWAGAPARLLSSARGPWHDVRPRNRPAWVLGYAAMAGLVAGIPIVGIAAGLTAAWPVLGGASSLRSAAVAAELALPYATVVGLIVVAGLVWTVVRAAGI